MGGVERRIAASHTRLLVERFRELPESARCRLEAQAAADLAAVALLSPGGWTPLQLQLNLVHALRGVTSETEYEDFWREQLLRSFRLESLAPALAGALRLFGASPTMLMKTSGSMWRLVSRGCGELRAELVDDGAMVVHLTHLPTEGYDFVEDWAVAWAGIFRGGLDLIGRASQVRMQLWEPRLGLAVYEAEYETDGQVASRSRSTTTSATTSTSTSTGAGVPGPVSPRDSEALACRT